MSIKRPPLNNDWYSNLHNSKERLDFLYRNEVFADVAFMVGSEKPQRIMAHRLILSMSSQVFSAMFYGPLAQVPETEITILDVEAEEFKALLRFIYTDEVKLTCARNVIKIAYAAKKYMVNDLYDQCMTFLNNNMTFSTVCQIHEAAYYLDNHLLERDSLLTIIQNTEKVLQETPAEELSMFILKKLTKLPYLPTLKEATLFHKILKWIDCSYPEKDKKREILDELLPSLFFLTMNTHDFVKACAEFPLLNDCEITSIAFNQVLPSSRSLPSWCSSEKRFRVGDTVSLCALQCSGDAMFRETDTVQVNCTFKAEEGNFVLQGADFNKLLHPAKDDDILEMEVMYSNDRTEQMNIFATSCKRGEYCKFPSPELVMQGDKCTIEITLQNPPKFYNRADVYEETEVKVGRVTIKLFNDDENDQLKKCPKIHELYICQLE